VINAARAAEEIKNYHYNMHLEETRVNRYAWRIISLHRSRGPLSNAWLVNWSPRSLTSQRNVISLTVNVTTGNRIERARVVVIR